MFLEILGHEYFWLSFLPITLMGAGFWLIYFDRADDIKEPLILLFLALIAGIASAVVFVWFGTAIGLENFYLQIVGEEITKVLFAILVMEILKRRFSTITQGIMYGFAVGIGFAMAENMVYLVDAYSEVGFTSDFWLMFQGRFWASSLLHGVTTAFFGLFYAGAYLSSTLRKGKNESPLRVFLVPPNIRQLWYILTLHTTRKHLLIKKEVTTVGHHAARTVVLEGLWLAILIHLIFNTALNLSRPIFAFLFAFIGMLVLFRYSVKK